MDSLSENRPVVLLVDDSPETLGMLNQALEQSEVTTLVALEGRQAISIAQKMTPDIILLDAVMPNMDGFETCRRLKSDNTLKHIPVIFMTGLTDTSSVVKGFEVGGVDYLTKPINPEELIARMHAHLMNARVTSSAQEALDSTGQSIFAVNSDGKTLWATPRVDKLLDELSKQLMLEAFSDTLKTWLSHNLAEGNKCHYQCKDISITAIYMGHSIHNEILVRLVNEQGIDDASVLQSYFSITKRESEVFLWLAKGKTNREIATILSMSPRTVNKHLEQLFKKLQVDNRTTAAGLALDCLQKNKPLN